MGEARAMQHPVGPCFMMASNNHRSQRSSQKQVNAKLTRMWQWVIVYYLQVPCTLHAVFGEPGDIHGPESDQLGGEVRSLAG